MRRKLTVLILAVIFGFAQAMRPDDFPKITTAPLKYENTSGDTYRGTLDQRTYTTWKNMKVVKRKVTGITNPSSTYQQQIRTYLNNLAASWSGLAEVEKSLWETIGQQIPQPNPEQGVRAIIRRSHAQQSGINTYIGHNSRILQAGGLVITAPVVANAPFGVSNLVASWGLPAVGDLSLSWTADPGASANDVLRIWIVSRSTVGGVPLVHKQIVATASVAGGSPATISDYRGALGVLCPFANIVGAELYLQCDVVDSTTGYFSVPSETIVTTVA